MPDSGDTELSPLDYLYITFWKFSLPLSTPSSARHLVNILISISVNIPTLSPYQWPMCLSIMLQEAVLPHIIPAMTLANAPFATKTCASFCQDWAIGISEALIIPDNLGSQKASYLTKPMGPEHWKSRCKSTQARTKNPKSPIPTFEQLVCVKW